MDVSDIAHWIGVEMGPADGPEGSPAPEGVDADAGVPSEVAWSVLALACDRVGLDRADAQLHRSGTTAVFRLGASVMVRIASEAGGLRVARRAVAVADFLESASYPAVRLLPRISQPLEVGGCAVTFWHPVAEEERWADLGQVGELLRRLHWLEEPASLGLEPLDPLSEIWRRFRVDQALADEHRSFLTDRAQVLAKRFEALDFVLPRGMVHGNVNVGNVLLDDDGSAVLTDLDGFGTGPREWDLVSTALYFERLGWHTRTEYEAFVEGYGFDVTSWYGYSTLADLRELVMTVRLSRRASADPAAAVELERRIHDLRTGADRHGWRPF